MFSVCIDDYRILAEVGSLPPIYDSYKKEASLAEEMNLDGNGDLAFIAVQAGQEGWPKLCLALRYEGHSGNFFPGVLVVPETKVVFIGAGASMWAYDLQRSQRIWEDSTEPGFWAWYRYGDTILMTAELEFAAWSTRGAKLWSTFVEPPWDFGVAGDMIELDVMGTTSHFSLVNGPQRNQD